VTLNLLSRNLVLADTVRCSVPVAIYSSGKRNKLYINMKTAGRFSLLAVYIDRAFFSFLSIKPRSRVIGLFTRGTERCFAFMSTFSILLSPFFQQELATMSKCNPRYIQNVALFSIQFRFTSITPVCLLPNTIPD
jgi:hypothetical protein